MTETLPLPVDIPWRRRCVTQDMTDTGEWPAPERWQPSLAVFEHQPPPEQQVLPGMVVSYLKVVATITGHALEEMDSPLYTAPYYYDPDVNQYLVQGVEAHLPCHGALLHVSVLPASDVPLEQYPYIADVEPKKRDLYERVTQTGSTLSRTLAATGIQRGGLGLSGTEVVDGGTAIDWNALGKVGGAAAGGALGGPAGAAVGGAVGGPVGDALGGQIEGLFGDKPTNKAPVQAVQTSDLSQERREEYSATTQLSQLHSLLTSYHTGTNRALFFMQPPPHQVQTDATLINGPRALEGVQEFALVVVRPASQPDVCVDVRLESAYVTTDAGPTTMKDLYEFNEKDHWPTATVPWGAWNTGFTAHDAAHAVTIGTHTKVGPIPYSPPPGWEFDPTVTDASTISSTDPKTKVTVTLDETKTSATITMDVPPVGAHQSGALWVLEYPKLYVGVTFHLRRRSLDDTSPQIHPWRIYVISRRLRCCPERHPIDDPGMSGVVFSGRAALEGDFSSLSDANRLAETVGEALLASVGSPARHQPVRWSESDGVAAQIADFIGFPDHPDDTALADIAGLDPEVAARLAETMPTARRSDLLRLTLLELNRGLGLGFEGALAVRRAALRLAEPPPPPVLGRRRARRREIPVPEVIGLAATDARQLLSRLGLEPETHWVDSPQPSGRVMAQHPREGAVAAGDRVVLDVATGLTVTIPPIVGSDLSRALCALREAGLRSEPQLVLHGKGNHVVRAVKPPPGELVSPHAEVRVDAGEA